jgi:putative ABC transport system ATP-binding protein
MVQLESVVKTYRKGDRRVTALAPIDLAVRPGEFVALQGPSGSGKTTCLLIAGGLLRPDSGRALIEGRDVYAMTPNQLAVFRSRTIGFVFQQYHLIPYLTVLENILAPEAAYGPGNHAGRARKLAERFGLAHRLDHTPGELSTGEKQRTALARALLFEPKIVLADEITGNLDEENSHIVLGFLREYVRSGGSVLLVTHDSEVAAGADRRQRIQNEGSRGFDRVPHAPLAHPTTNERLFVPKGQRAALNNLRAYFSNRAKNGPRYRIGAAQ